MQLQTPIKALSRMTSTEAPTSTTTLVLGGTGKTGRRIIERMEAKGCPVRVGSRSAPQPFEWNDSSTWAPALQGVSSVYIAFYPDLAVPGATETIQSFVEEAVKSGVQHLVLLSGRGESEAQQCERIVQDADVDWTILRVSWFSENFSEAFLRDLVLDGTVALPAGEIKEPFISAEDIADVATAVLTEPGHRGQLYELTGPRLITFREAVEAIAQATGQEISYVPISMEAFVAALTDQNIPADFIALLHYLFENVLDGHNAYLTDGVQRVLKRAPQNFTTYAQCTAVTGVWNS